MKLRHLTLCITIVLFLTAPTFAKSVNPDQARKAATAFYYEHASQYQQVDYKSLAVKNEQMVTYEGTLVYYVFNFTRGGWVLVSADDRAIPVIGYSFEGDFDPTKASCCLKWWMKGINDQIKQVIDNNEAAIDGAPQQWDYLLSRTVDNLNVVKSKDVTPLMLATWDQGKYYNALCPLASDGPDGRALVGCVATAMAQIMYYYRYPAQGQGSHGGITFSNYYYRWNEMLNGLSNYNQGVAEISYHAGRAVDMYYSGTGSGANTDDVPGAMESYFRYASDANYSSKTFYSTTNWNNLLKGNLDLGYPIEYSGTDPDDGGHAWVCDGYQGTDYFHMNWGWSGYGNGYFYLNDLSVAGSTFGSWQGAAYNLHPPTTSYPAFCTGTTNVTYTYGTIEDGSGPSNYQNNANCQWLIEPTEVIAKLIISANALNTESGNDVITIYDGTTTAAPVLATWSGSAIPTSLQTTGDAALVVFTSNGSTNASGWQLEYRSVYPVYCSGVVTLTDPSGNIVDGSAANNYSYNQTCRWSINPPDVSAIALDFTEFNVASDDWVKIYDQNTSDELASYVGTSIPPFTNFPTNKLLVYFKTNGANNGGGWALNYSSTPLGTEENELPVNMAIYPNPANDKLYLNVSSIMDGRVMAEVITLDGRLVWSQDMGKRTAVFAETLDVSGLAQGIYVFRLTTEAGNLNTKLVIR